MESLGDTYGVSSSLMEGSRGARLNLTVRGFLYITAGRGPSSDFSRGLIIMTEDPNMRRFKYLLFMVVILLNGFWLVPVRAQEAKGMISGTVKDPAGGVLVGALV